MLNNTLNIKRLIAILKMDFRQRKRLLIVVVLGVFALMSFVTFVNVMDTYGEPNATLPKFYEPFYAALLLGGGFLYSSISFREFNRKETAFSYLSLPASHLEKFLSKWLQTALFFPLALTLIFLLLPSVTGLLVSPLTDLENPGFDLSMIVEGNWLNTGMDFKVYHFIPFYMALQSIFLLGAITFQKGEIFKTIIVAFIVFITLVLLGFLSFSDYLFSIAFYAENNIRIEPSEGMQDFLENSLGTLAVCIFGGVMPLALWTATYLKLTEKQV